ncbi:glycosyltransferase [Arvimicrobium flavum]|uniref:glycosyltransferase n=1 Tax=Arvimicrobium flavum TaxID=3393320 RepID=UPI00237A8F63|nr:glycosyltransferase [Mesorhizobium shangrilense]
MLRVLVFGRFLDEKPGGIQSHVEHLFHAMRGAVDYVHLVPTRDWSETREVLHGFPVLRKRGMDIDGTVALSPGLISEAWRLGRTGSFDLVHLHFPDPMTHIASMAIPASIPRVISWHADIVRQRYVLPFYRPFLKAAAKRAGAIIAPTPRHRDGSPILSQLADQSHIKVVPYGFDLTPFTIPAPEAAEIRAKFGAPLIFSLGRHVSYKGFDVLIRAMADIRGDAHLVLGGEGPLTGELRALAASLSVSGRVHFVGMVPPGQLSAYYQACDVFCLPSVTVAEAFGIVQVEAMASGRPVVSTKLNTGVDYANQDGVTGFTVTPGNSAELAERLNLLLGDTALATTMGEAARQRALGVFTLEQMRVSTLKVYESALARSGRHAGKGGQTRIRNTGNPL